uniref:3'-5' exonuclease n=2 Tax=Kalmanozyma brasiliensis (strain GHG001) TaxID=1365824 RepID=V5F1I9_KALBG
MRSGTKAGARKLPKTWQSTHGAKWDDSIPTPAAAKGKWRSKPGKVFQPKLTPAQAAKEAERQELERHLEVYTHKLPAGPPHSAGSSFLSPLSKPSSSSYTLDQPLLPNGTTSRGTTPRLKTPMIAYTADYEEASELLACLGPGPMGLDLEWNFNHYTGPNRTALLQICSPSLILIIHLSAMSHRVPPLLKSILEDPNVIKTGVAIKNDALKLQRDYAIDTRNVLELGNLVKLAQPERWASVKHLISLRDLTRIYLGRKLRKDSVRVSDWEKYPLDPEQIEYAASDTFASLEVLRAVAEYFKPSASEGGTDKWLLEQLDRIDSARANPAMELEQALKASAYDLLEEKMQQEAFERQKQNWRPALRTIQPEAPAPPAPPSRAPVKPVQAKPPAITPTKPRANPKIESDDDFVTVSRVNLAHDRAMSRWLYSQQTLDQIAASSKIKITTAAMYLNKALSEAKRAASGKGAGERGILDDFTMADKRRLEHEMKGAGPACKVSLSQYRGLARALGWRDAVSSPSGSEDEGGSLLSSPKTQKRPAPVQKTSAKGAAALKWSSPWQVVEVSDDEVEVVDTSR